ncbi:MAG: cation:proton antiporter, partial [Sphingobacterium sp.]
MRKHKATLFYILVIIIGIIIGYAIINQGKLLEENLVSTSVVPEVSSWTHFTEQITQNLAYPFGILLLQIIAIILAARFVGMLFRKIGQPAVIGETVAGIALGPSLLGMYFPSFSTFLFPVESLGNLGVLSQIGLILFMFVVGMELDLNILKKKAHDAVVISHASIIFPFLLGIALTYMIYQSTAPVGISFLSYALFIGISMSITAFPVLARIIQERGMTKTRLGSIAITCAAADDITAWCLLAAVIAVVKAGSVTSAIYTILFAGAYVFLMLRFVKPFLQRVGDLHANKERLGKHIVGIFFLTLLISAWSTEVIGIHALFGAFMAGVIMPSNTSFRSIFIEKVEDVAQVLLLPLFFVFTGLRTQIGLLSDPEHWQTLFWVVSIAVTGKFVGSASAARMVGQSWHNSLSIGALMNTRGLMELVALNIGYDLGVLTAEMFAILVLMALITTFMTGPALDIINKFVPEINEKNKTIFSGKNKFNILISFGNPDTGKLLLRLANMFTQKSPDNSTITALHLALGNELNSYNSVEFEKESFAPLHDESQRLNQPYKPIFQGTDSIEQVIITTANKGDYDLLLTGMGQSIYEGSMLGRILGFTNKVMNPENLYSTLTGREKKLTHSWMDMRTYNLLKS